MLSVKEQIGKTIAVGAIFRAAFTCSSIQLHFPKTQKKVEKVAIAAAIGATSAAISYGIGSVAESLREMQYKNRADGCLHSISL